MNNYVTHLPVEAVIINEPMHMVYQSNIKFCFKIKVMLKSYINRHLQNNEFINVKV